MATRLVRRLCQSCREAYTPTKQDLKTLGRLAEKVDGRKLYRAGSGCEHVSTNATATDSVFTNCWSSMTKCATQFSHTKMLKLLKKPH